MIPFLQNIIGRVVGNWKTSLIGTLESLGMIGLSQIVHDRAATKMALGLAAWRFVVGLLSRDPA